MNGTASTASDIGLHRRILLLNAQGVSYRGIARITKLSKSAVHRIVTSYHRDKKKISDLISNVKENYEKVLVLVGAGFSVSEISDFLCVSPQDVVAEIIKSNFWDSKDKLFRSKSIIKSHSASEQNAWDRVSQEGGGVPLGVPQKKPNSTSDWQVWDRVSQTVFSSFLEKMMLLRAKGLSYDRIADIVGIPVIQVRTILEAVDSGSFELGHSGTEGGGAWVYTSGVIESVTVKNVPGTIEKRGEYGELLDFRVVPIPYQLFFARYGYLPKHIFPIRKGELSYGSYHKVYVLKLSTGEIVYTYDDFSSKKGCYLEGTVETLNCGSENGNLKFDDFLLLCTGYTLSQVLQNEGDVLRLLGFHVSNMDELRHDLEEGNIDLDNISIDIEKAFNQIAPNVVGNEDLKEIITYSIVRRDLRKPALTSVPVIFFAKSGEGKTVFLNDLHNIFNADLYRAEDLTYAALGMVDPSTGEIKYTGLSDIILVDEIDKAQAKTVSLLLEIAGMEMGHRVRYGVKFEKETGSLLIGSFLATTKLGIFDEDKGGSWGRVGNIHRQLLRRSVILSLDSSNDRVDKTLFKKVLYDMEDDKKYDDLGELSKLLCLTKLFLLTCKFKLKGVDEIEEELYREICGFRFAETTAWHRTLFRLIKLLAEGRALCHGLDRVDINKKVIYVLPEDFRRVVDILKKHAISLGFYKPVDIDSVSSDYSEPENIEVEETTIVDFDEDKVTRTDSHFFDRCSFCGEMTMISHFYDGKYICDKCLSDMRGDFG